MIPKITSPTAYCIIEILFLHSTVSDGHSLRPLSEIEFSRELERVAEEMLTLAKGLRRECVESSIEPLILTAKGVG